MSDDTKQMNKTTHIDVTRIQEHLCKLARGSVEEALNASLAADALCGAQRYARIALIPVLAIICVNFIAKRANECPTHHFRCLSWPGGFSGRVLS